MDIEEGQIPNPDLNVNYTALAKHLGRYPGEISLLRFRELNIRNFLFYQSQLVHLQRQLDMLEELDAQQNPQLSDRINYRWSVSIGNSVLPTPPDTHMRQSKDRAEGAEGAGADGVPDSDRQKKTRMSDLYTQTVLEIRKTLENYNQAVDLHSRLEVLPSPPKSSLLSLAAWLNRKDLGQSFLSGDSEDVWSSPRAPGDFLTFSSSAGLAFSLSRGLVQLKRAVTPASDVTRIYSVDGSEGSRLAQLISVAASSLLPVLPVVVLFFIENALLRIGLILVFTAMFSVVLVTGLKLSPDKVLAITTAIAAIQVVYVGSASG